MLLSLTITTSLNLLNQPKGKTMYTLDPQAARKADTTGNQIKEIGKYDGYRPLAVEIAKFFCGGPAPVSAAETLQIYAFMEAADESKRQGGCPVSIESVMAKARAAAAKCRPGEL